MFVWRECLAHQVPIVLTVLSFRFSGLCLMVVNATIHFHGQASPVGVWSFLRLPPNPSRGKKKEKLPDFCRIFAIRPRRNVRGPTVNVRGPHSYPGGSPQFAFLRKTPHTALPKKLASSSARPAAALRDDGRSARYERPKPIG